MPADLRHLLLALGTLDEQDVGASLCVGLATAQGLVEAEAGTGISAGHDEEIGRTSGCSHHRDLTHHVVGWDHAPARGMSAALGEHLVLDLDCRSTGGLVALDRALKVKEPAEPGIGIAHDRR